MTARTADITAANEGRAYWVLADRGRILLSGERTGGAYTVVETTAAPGGGPPPHVHHREDELFYVVEGELALVYADRQYRAVAGDAVFLPRGVPHTFAPAGTGLAKFLVLATPAGFERFTAEVGTEIGPLGRADAALAPPRVTPEAVQRLIAVAAKYGIELLPDHRPGPAAELPRHAERHWVWGEHVRVILPAGRTNGQFTLAEVTSRPGGGVPPHRHAREDELFYVLEGSYEFAVGDEAVAAGPGTFLRVPRGQWHGFANTGGTRGRLLDVHTPGGFEAFFRDAGTPCADADAGPPPGPPPDPSYAAAVCARHGMDLRPRG